MRALLLAVILAALAPLAARSTARAQDAEAEAAPDDAAPLATIVVVVESASRAVRPAALRRSLRARLPGVDVVALQSAAEAPRARVLVGVARDGSAALYLVTRAGREQARQVPASASSDDAARQLAEQISELLSAAEADPPALAATRHGLIPWEDDGRGRNSGFERVQEEALLPWPQGQERTPSPRRWVSPEGGDGLATPPPPTQNR